MSPFNNTQRKPRALEEQFSLKGLGGMESMVPAAQSCSVRTVAAPPLIPSVRHSFARHHRCRPEQSYRLSSGAWLCLIPFFLRRFRTKPPAGASQRKWQKLGRRRCLRVLEGPRLAKLVKVKRN